HQVMKSATTFAALDDVVGNSGTTTFTPATGAPVSVSLTGSTTISGLASLINAENDSPVTASVVQVSPGQYKLVLTSKSTGTDNAFTVTETIGAGLTLPDADGDGIAGDGTLADPDADLTQTAQNASLTVNGLAISSASNTVET